MNIFTKIALLKHVLGWRLTWSKHNCDYVYKIPENPKFMGSKAAVGLIPDGAVVATSGLAGNQRAAVIYWAVREVYKATGKPKGITILCTGGQGGRGVVPGSVEEMGVEGLCTRMVAGHLETFKAMLKLADKGKLELQCIPQGTLALLLRELGEGRDSLVTTTGVGTFCDPRVGRGSPVTDPNAEQLITVEGDQLRYRLPKITTAIFGAPAADREGNIYVEKASVIAESMEIARAARANGGKVIVNVGMVVEKGYGKVFIPGSMVDAIVVDPDAEQCASIKHRKYWSFLTTDSKIPLEKAIDRVRFVNKILGITPRRTPVDDVLARLGASVFSEIGHKGMLVNIGVGLPEEVCRLIYEGGLLKDIMLLTESGVLGGLPAPGVFFGASVCPQKIMSSTEIFQMCYEKLDITILGALEVDSDGNVNVSKRGEGAINYVGPGGFIDLTAAAKNIIFVASWMARGEMKVENGKVVVTKPGKAKFIEKVSEITFSGKRALEQGKIVYYVTNVGVFRLTERGMELCRVMPGVDIQKDILDYAPMKIVLPEGGKDKVPVVDSGIITGQGFKLSLK